MFNLVSLVVAAALVSHQYGFEANAEVNPKILDNSLKPHASPRQSRQFKKLVIIRSSPGAEVKRAAGERMVLECVAIGNPAPNAYWMKNGEIVQDPSEDMNQLIPFPTGFAELTTRLILTSTTPGEDEVSCVAEAGANRDVATTVVYTTPTPVAEEELLTLENLFLPSKPLITYNYNNLFATEGSAVLLPCRAQSQAPTEIEWLDRNDQPIYRSSRMRVLPSGDLLITSLRWAEDLGNFTCVAANAFGKGEASTFVYPVKA